MKIKTATRFMVILVLTQLSVHLHAMNPRSSTSLPLGVQNSISPGGIHSDDEQQQRDLNNRLVVAIVDGRLDKALLLIGRGANVNFRTLNDRTPLIIAAAEGDSRMCSLLMAHGANPIAATRMGYTALMRAAHGGHDDAVKILLTEIPVSEQKKILKVRESVLAAQMAFKKTQVVLVKDIRKYITQQLLNELVDEQMARVDHMIAMKNKYAETAFSEAIRGGHMAVVELLDPCNEKSRLWIRQELAKNINEVLIQAPRLGRSSGSGPENELQNGNGSENGHNNK